MCKDVLLRLSKNAMCNGNKVTDKAIEEGKIERLARKRRNFFKSPALLFYANSMRSKSYSFMPIGSEANDVLLWQHDEERELCLFSSIG